LRARATIGVGAETFRTPALWVSADEHAPSRAFFSTPCPRAGLGFNFFLVILVVRHRRRHAPHRRKRPARTRHDDCEHMRGYATLHPGQGSRGRHRLPERRKPGTLRISIETAGASRDAEGFPRQPERAYGGRLVFARENARDGFGHPLDGASSAEPARSISGNRPKPVQGRRCFPRRLQGAGQGQRPPTGGAKRVSRLGAGVAANVRRPFPKVVLISRYQKAATRPVARSYPSVMRGLSPTRSASNGCTRRFSPSAPQE
jgi:hypothetical protein